MRWTKHQFYNWYLNLKIISWYFWQNQGIYLKKILSIWKLIKINSKIRKMVSPVILPRISLKIFRIQEFLKGLTFQHVRFWFCYEFNSIVAHLRNSSIVAHLHDFLIRCTKIENLSYNSSRKTSLIVPTVWWIFRPNVSRLLAK